MDEVAAAARYWGVESEYFDGFGRRHLACAATLERLVAAVSKGRDKPVQFDQPAPRRAYQGNGRRLWAIALQLYAVRSRRNWGHGDFTDLARLVSLAAAHGAAAIGVNPLHALFIDRATRPTAGSFSIRFTSMSRRSRNSPAAPLQASSRTSSRCVCPS
jgi:4-alpha-glucanotransferase